MDDQELVRRLLEHDENAQRQFYHLYREKLYRTCIYILGYHDPDAEDIVQEVFISALKRLSYFQFIGSLYGWLYKSCVHMCYERVRKRKRLVNHLNEELERLSQQRSVDQHEYDETKKARDEVQMTIKKQIQQMSANCREIFELRDEMNSSYAAIADKLRIPIGTVMSRLARCKEMLKKRVLAAMGEVKV